MSLPRVLDDEELDAMNALNHILTGTATSRIYGKARAKGLAYFVGAYSGSSFYDSAWDLSGQVNHDTAPALFDIIGRELKAVLDGKLTDEEIESAKSFGLGRYQMGAQTVSQISGFYTNRYFADDCVKDYDKVPDMIRKVTREKIMKVAQEFFDANISVLAAVSSGDREEIIDLNSRLKKLYPVEEE
jgi:predicted Zn-dependent peptidase